MDLGLAGKVAIITGGAGGDIRPGWVATPALDKCDAVSRIAIAPVFAGNAYGLLAQMDGSLRTSKRCSKVSLQNLHEKTWPIAALCRLSWNR